MLKLVVRIPKLNLALDRRLKMGPFRDKQRSSDFMSLMIEGRLLIDHHLFLHIVEMNKNDPKFRKEIRDSSSFFQYIFGLNLDVAQVLL